MGNKIFALLICILIILFFIAYKSLQECFAVVAADGEAYTVVESKNAEAAADMLGRLNINNIKLLRHLKEHHPDKYQTQLLLSRYSPNIIREHLPSIFAPETSYIQNKGEEACFCLRGGKDKPTKSTELVDFNTLMFVNLHEMSHLAEYVHGHPRKFWQTFKFLLQEGIKIGMYQPIDYAKYPVQYCGLEIYYNPYYDESM
jgi:hypothetical protein